MADYLQSLRDMLASRLQQKFDPRYNEVQAGLFNMQNKNKKDAVSGQPIIGSDTTGQSLYSIMDNSPRWEDLSFQGRMQDSRQDFALRHGPMSSDYMNMLMQQIKKYNADNVKQNMMMGGGI